MSLRSILAGLAQRTQLLEIPSRSGLHSQRVFRAMIERERARVDRNAHSFSMVMFKVGDLNAHRDQADRLVREIARRRRFTDEMGIFDDEQIGVLLPETSIVGARKFADDILKLLSSRMTCSIHMYPDSGPPGSRTEDPRQLTFLKELQGRAAPASGGLPVAHPQISSFSPLHASLAGSYPGWKRGLDVLGAAIGLVVLSPLFLLIAVAIKLVSPGPVFYKQSRVGHLGNTFTCWKFRTMKLDSDPAPHRKHFNNLVQTETPMVKLDGLRDPRVIPFGAFLRLTGLDELPQLLNVLRGEMSLIGPRPCIEYESQSYSPWHMRRFDTRPGLTGLWQVSGKNRTTFNQMMRLDISYGRRHSLWVDVKILLKTIPAILSHAFFHSSRRRDKNQQAGLA
jgi:lipopolysaccharide/colanic/teichoic acid biosynthesis glycosyltransferase